MLHQLLLKENYTGKHMDHKWIVLWVSGLNGSAGVTHLFQSCIASYIAIAMHVSGLKLILSDLATSIISSIPNLPATRLPYACYDNIFCMQLVEIAIISYISTQEIQLPSYLNQPVAIYTYSYLYLSMLRIATYSYSIK